MKSIKDGSWFDTSTWDAGRIPNETEDVHFAHTVTYNKNIVRRAGTLYSRGGWLKPVNINEAAFVGTIEDKTDPRYPKDADGIMDSDVGIWMVGTSQIDCEGTNKKVWTKANASLLKGTTSFAVADASGWKQGDEIVICPTRTPGLFEQDWNDAANSPIDSFGKEYERRIIKSISGNTVTIDPLQFDHLTTTINPEGWFTGKTMNAWIVNNTNTVKIGGNPGNRSHVLIKSSKPQNIKYVEFSYMGPRQGGTRPDIHLGRYPLHFHHAGNGSRGTKIVGCTFHDTGNRTFVPHGSHGITATDNAIIFFHNDAYWYDPQHVTNDLILERNFAGGVVYGRAGHNTMGYQFGQGDGNVARENVACGCKMGEIGTGGNFVWNADNEGVWIFENNIGCCSTTDFFNWQNSPHQHLIKGHLSYNCVDCGLNGAYINSYNFIDCVFYNGLWQQKATPGNSTPMFDRCIFDGAKKLPFVVEMLGSPVPAGVPNSFIRCVFKDYTDTAILMNTHFLAVGEVATKAVDLVSCSFTGPIAKFTPDSLFNSYFRIQPASGQAVKITQQGTTNITPFAPKSYGNGSGLSAEYYNGSNFESLAFKRIDTLLKFQQWSIDKAASPTGVHYLITGDAYSVRWTGFVESQYTEAVQLAVYSFGGVRLWLDDKLVINRWTENSDWTLDGSAPIPMVAGQKYKLKIEHTNTGGARGFLLNWLAPSAGNEVRVIPQQQLYPSTTVPLPAPVDPVPTPIPNPIPTPAPVTLKANAGVDLNVTGNKATLDASASTGAASYKWYPDTGPNVPNLVNQDGKITEVNGLVNGTYEFVLVVQDAAGNKSEDRVKIIVGTVTPPPVPTVFKSAAKSKDFTRNNCPAGSTGSLYTYKIAPGVYESTTSQAAADALADADINANGQNAANQFGTCTAVPVPTKKLIATVKVYDDGSIEKG